MILSTSCDTPLGKINIVASSKAILSVQFVNSKTKNKNPNSDLLCEAIDQLHRYFSGSLRKFELPLLWEGTPFQLKAWKAINRIPYGETRTYGELSKLIKSPQGARAVGGACNKNKFMIVIPCHRVLGAQGKLTGYAKGIKIKQALLELENKNLNFLKSPDKIGANKFDTPE